MKSVNKKLNELVKTLKLLIKLTLELETLITLIKLIITSLI